MPRGASASSTEAAAKSRARTDDVIARASTRGDGETSIASTSSASFTDLHLDAELTRALRRCGFDVPSPIQLSCVPLGRFGCDIIAQAKSGTGKTMTFVVIALEAAWIDDEADASGLRATTREVAVQSHDCFVELIEKFKESDDARGGFRRVLVGGLPVKEDRARLAESAAWWVRTPDGRDRCSKRGRWRATARDC